MTAQNIPLRFTALRAAYREGSVTPSDVVLQVLERIAQRGGDHVWTMVADSQTLLARAAELAARIDEIDRLPLYGLPFGVKDNVDVAGVATTCGCPSFGRLPLTVEFHGVLTRFFHPMLTHSSSSRFGSGCG